MLVVERDVKSPKYEILYAVLQRRGGGAINREGAFIQINTVAEKQILCEMI